MKNTNKNMDMALYTRMREAWKNCTGGTDDPFSTLNPFEYEWFEFITARYAKEIIEFNLPGIDLNNSDSESCQELMMVGKYGKSDDWTKRWYQYADKEEIKRAYNYEYWRSHCIEDYLPEEPEETFMGLPNKVTIA